MEGSGLVKEAIWKGICVELMLYQSQLLIIDDLPPAPCSLFPEVK
jgi:hypothetical protein